jgi:hypothetical protein
MDYLTTFYVLDPCSSGDFFATFCNPGALPYTLLLIKLLNYLFLENPLKPLHLNVNGYIVYELSLANIGSFQYFKNPLLFSCLLGNYLVDKKMQQVHLFN